MTMNQEDKDQQRLDESLDNALSLMEQSGDDSPEDIRRRMDDPEAMRACKLLYKYKNAMGREAVARPDVDAEWRRFRRRNKPYAASRGRQFWLGSLAGAAAAVVLVLGGLWWGGYLRKPEPVMVYQSVDAPRRVVLETADGSMPVDDDADPLDALHGVAGRTDDGTLAYAPGAQLDAGELHTLSTPAGKDFKLILADGTTVWLNDRSRLQYPARFTGAERRVRLQGEAYFDVARQSGDVPFIVETDRMQVRVLGTEFNLSDHAGDRSHVTLVEGSVEVCGARGDRCVRIEPGEDACLNDDGSFAIRQVDTDVYVYWKEGYFFFDDAPLSDIMQQIGRWYNVDVVFDNIRAMSLRLHFFCERAAGIEAALAQLNILRKFKAEYRDGVVHIY